MTRLGDFLNFSCDKNPSKVHKHLVTFGTILENITFKEKTFEVIFGKLLVEIGQIDNLTSGHTAHWLAGWLAAAARSRDIELHLKTESC